MYVQLNESEQGVAKESSSRRRPLLAALSLLGFACASVAILLALAPPGLRWRHPATAMSTVIGAARFSSHNKTKSKKLLSIQAKKLLSSSSTSPIAGRRFCGGKSLIGQFSQGFVDFSPAEDLGDVFAGNGTGYLNSDGIFGAWNHIGCENISYQLDKESGELIIPTIHEGCIADILSIPQYVGCESELSSMWYDPDEDEITAYAEISVCTGFFPIDFTVTLHPSEYCNCTCT
mmetsp:Transcript_112879/g.207193  ORF Transcript_112879/g.207193 Transcript_112879/m.207193 type:complete len:233 (+) Transcript_112879:65-763(+)